MKRDALSIIERSIPVRIRNRRPDVLSGFADLKRRVTLLESARTPGQGFRQSGNVRELLDLGVDTYKTNMLPALLQSYAHERSGLESAASSA